MSGSGRPESTPIQSLGRELKFVLSNARAPLALSVLRAHCQPDPKHPVGTVSSIYYDNHGLRLLREKVNSDYLKTKVRLRWYDRALDAHGFIEAKFRVGDRRDKIRVQTPHTAHWLAATPLHEPLLVRVPELLRPHGLWVDPGLRPLFQVRYRRHRFIEPLTGSRVSLDADIRVPATNSSALRFPAPVSLGSAVVEIKGPQTELPVVLRELLHLGCRRSSFSKYGSAYQCLAGRGLVTT